MDLLNVQALFDKGIFTVPNYQRGYAWEREQIKDFLEDLEEATDANVKAHYTGAITVVNKGQKRIFPKTFDVFDVVDGQQRLTTFSIFISCFCNRLRHLGGVGSQEDIKSIRENIEFKEIPLLELNNQTNDFYKKYILKGLINQLPDNCSNKAQQNLADAKKQITKFLEKFQIDQIQELYETLTSKFQVNFHTLSNENEVGVVFETMNNRGLPLTQMDKVKNYLIYLSGHLETDETKKTKLAEHINSCFGAVFEELMKMQATSLNQENDFLRYSYLVYSGTNQSDVHYEIKKNLLPKKGEYTTIKNLLDYVNFLKKAAAVYSKLKRGDIANAKLKTLVQKIIWLGNPTNFIPLLISLFMRYDENELFEALKCLEIFSFMVYKINNHKPVAAQKELHKLAFGIFYQTKNIYDITAELPKNKYASSFYFVGFLEIDDFYLRQDNPAIAYLLFEYEQHLHEIEKSEFQNYSFEKFERDWNSGILQIEHISPQTPLQNDPLKNVHKLGNLTLTFQNAALSNKEFHNKIKIYEHSNLFIEKKLARETKWNGTSINARTTELVSFARKRWNFGYEFDALFK